MGDFFKKNTPTGIAWKPPLLTPAPFTHPVVSVLFTPLIFDVTLGTRERSILRWHFQNALEEWMEEKKKSDDI